MIRSLYTRLSLAFAGVLVLAVITFVGTLRLVVTQQGGPARFVEQTFDMNLETVRTALADGGPSALADHLRRLEATYQARHYLTDAAGIDLLDGTDRSDLIRRAWNVAADALPVPPPPLLTGDERIVVYSSADGRARLVAVAHPAPGGNPMWYFIWIPVGVVFACLLVTYRVVRPLVRLRSTVERFGRGDLGARANLTRRDEIGDLARAFDQTAERVERLMTAERRLLQDVSHELRSPLARLAFAVELVDSGPDRAAATERVRREVRRMAELVGELIELTRAEGEPAVMEVEPVDLDGVVHEVVADAGVEAEARGVRVEVRTQTVRLCGRLSLLRRAIENVVRNAVRYAPPGTAVQVGLMVAEEVARVNVRDYGPGVPEEMLEMIFAPFVRVEADRGRDASGEGVGLGLAIARRAVAVHGGRVIARNAGPGLEVQIKLPVGIYKA